MFSTVNSILKWCHLSLLCKSISMTVGLEWSKQSNKEMWKSALCAVQGKREKIKYASLFSVHNIGPGQTIHSSYRKLNDLFGPPNRAES